MLRPCLIINQHATCRIVGWYETQKVEGKVHSQTTLYTDSVELIEIIWRGNETRPILGRIYHVSCCAVTGKEKAVLLLCMLDVPLALSSTPVLVFVPLRRIKGSENATVAFGTPSLLG